MVQEHKESILHYIHTVDYLIVGLYFFFIAGIGILLNRRASESLDDYFLGGRKLPWWMLGFTGMGYYVNISGTLIIIAFVYMLGPRGMYIEFRGGACLVLSFMLLWTGKWHRRSGCMTQAEWMIFRFGRGTGAQLSRLFQVVAIVALSVGMLGLTIKALGIFLSTFIPLQPWMCSLIFVGIAAFYTTLSGFYGVVVTDLIQGAMVLFAAVVCAVLAIVKVPTVNELSMIAEQVTGNVRWTTSLPTIHTALTPGYEQYSNLLSFAVSYLFLNILLGMGVSGAEPIYFGARNDRECGTLSFVWILTMTFRWLLIMAFAVFGILLVRDLFPDHSVITAASDLIRAHAPDVTQGQWNDLLSRIALRPETFSPELIAGLQDLLKEDWSDKLKMVSYFGNINPETVMPMVLGWSIPAGLRGIILICLIAAAMSTLDITINKAAGFFVKDLYQAYLRPKAPNKELIFASYGFTVLLVAAGFVLAYTVRSVNDVWGWMVMSLNAGLVAPAMLRLYWWRFSGSAFAFGTGLGIVASVLQRIYLPDLDERLQMVLVLGTTIFFTVLVSFIFKPAPPEVLENFYRRTRPFGFWGPLKRKLTPEIRTKMEREHRSDIIAVPFVMGWQVTMFLMAMQIVIQEWRSFIVTFGVSLVCIAGMYVFWYRRLPGENFWDEADEKKILEPIS